MIKKKKRNSKEFLYCALFACLGIYRNAGRE